MYLLTKCLVLSVRQFPSVIRNQLALNLEIWKYDLDTSNWASKFEVKGQGHSERKRKNRF